MVEIRLLQAGDDITCARWDAFVHGNPSATFFHLSKWKEIISQNFGHETYFIYALRDDRVVGVLPLARVKSWLFGHSLIGLPFAVYGGVVADSDSDAIALENAGVELAEKLEVDYLELRNIEKRRSSWPTQDLYMTFKMRIPEILDDKMTCIPQKRRNMIRKAIKLGLKPRFSDSVDRFFPVFAANSRDHGTPAMPKAYFHSIIKCFPDNTEIISIENEKGDCISSILCFFFKGEVLAYYAGEVPEAKRGAANDLKYWAVMNRAKARGCSVFDLGRSKRNTGSFEFKRLWGFEPQQLNYQYYLINRSTVPQVNPSNPKYRIFIEAWKRLPIGVANFIGPRVVRNLG